MRCTRSTEYGRMGSMQISWHGNYTVKIISKDTTLVLDPTALRAKADVVALSNPSDSTMSQLSGIQGEPLVIDTPGEYSLKEFTLHSIGWHAEDGNERSLMRWNVEDMVILHIGALNRELEEQELRELERTDIDVFLVPVGGGTGLTTKQALHMVSTIEPRVVIPIHYNVPGSAEKLEGVKAFADEMGVSNGAPEKKVILKASKLPAEDMQTFILAP